MRCASAANIGRCVPRHGPGGRQSIHATDVGGGTANDEAASTTRSRAALATVLSCQCAIANDMCVRDTIDAVLSNVKAEMISDYLVGNVTTKRRILQTNRSLESRSAAFEITGAGPRRRRPAGAKATGNPKLWRKLDALTPIVQVQVPRDGHRRSNNNGRHEARSFL